MNFIGIIFWPSHSLWYPCFLRSYKIWCIYRPISIRGRHIPWKRNSKWRGLTTRFYFLFWLWSQCGLRGPKLRLHNKFRHSREGAAVLLQFKHFQDGCHLPSRICMTLTTSRLWKPIFYLRTKFGAYTLIHADILGLFLLPVLILITVRSVETQGASTYQISSKSCAHELLQFKHFRDGCRPPSWILQEIDSDHLAASRNPHTKFGAYISICGRHIPEKEF